MFIDPVFEFPQFSYGTRAIAIAIANSDAFTIAGGGDTLAAIDQYDLTDQISRSCKAIPRLIAEGYAKRHQKMGFQKYIDDAMAECNETIVSLEQCKDIYNIDSKLIEELVDNYDKSARQLYKLANAWTSFKRNDVTRNR